MCFALFARANIPQKLPGINAQFVAVVPVEFDGIFAHAFGGDWFGFFFEHGQFAGLGFGRFSRFAFGFFPFVVTERAGARVAQIYERIVGAVAVLPFDVHAVAGG